MDVREWSLFRVTRDADLDVSDEADDLLEAVELELRRARFGEVTRLEVAGVDVAADARAAPAGATCRRRPRLSARGDARPRRPRPAVRTSTGPTSRTTSGAPCARPPWNSIETASEQFAAIRNGDLLVHHPVRLVRGELRVVRRPRRRRPERDRDQVDRVPDERRHAARAGADRERRSAASRPSASSRSRRAATSAGTSSSHARSSRRESTSSTASPA